jgi:hypothetical protein
MWDSLLSSPPVVASSDGTASSKQPTWSSQKNLFPNTPATVAPPADLLAELSAPADNKKAIVSDGKAFSPHDPGAPGFDARQYYVSFTGKYKCPHLGCTSVTFHLFHATSTKLALGRALLLARPSLNT